jgi:hypothetical protein
VILIARHLYDPVADALALALGPRVRSWFIEQWLGSCATVHTVGAAGVDTVIRAGDGSALLDGAVTVVLNRVRQIPAARYHRADAVDQQYALAEATATFWSCMAGLRCPVLNSVPALGLVGRAADPLARVALAHAAGLPVRAFRLSTRVRFGESRGMVALEAPFPVAGQTVNAPAWLCSRTSGHGELWIVGMQVLGALDGIDAVAASAFAQRVGMGFGVLYFARDDHERWLWTGLDCLPLQAPPAVLEALATWLCDPSFAAPWTPPCTPTCTPPCREPLGMGGMP